MKITGILFILLGLGPVLINLQVLWKGIVRRESGSFTPIFGGVFLALGLWVIGVPVWGVILGFFLDCSIPMIIFYTIKEALRSTDDRDRAE